jgi:hypothetical protein
MRRAAGDSLLDHRRTEDILELKSIPSQEESSTI